jgi:hypothetical protein
MDYRQSLYHFTPPHCSLNTTAPEYQSLHKKLITFLNESQHYTPEKILSRYNLQGSFCRCRYVHVLVD